MNAKWKILGAVLGLMLCVGIGVALADVSATAYHPLRGDTAPALTHDTISSVQTTTWTTPLDPHPTRGNPTLAAFADFGTANATATLQCGLYFKNADGSYTFLGTTSAGGSLTAGASGVTDGGKFPATATATFDTRGATHYDLRVTVLSTGTISVRPWLYGSDSTGKTAP